MYTIENHVGRLIELRFETPLTTEQLAGYTADASRVLSAHTTPVVGCTDLTGARVFNQKVTDQLVAIIHRDSPKIERSAFLVGESAVFSMQIERILREAGHANRRAFHSLIEMSTWLGEVLNTAERRRLALFVRDVTTRIRPGA